MTLEPKASLEKQPDWIDNFIEEFLILYPKVNRYSIEILLKKHLPKEDINQNTTVPNVLLYEAGYKEWYKDGNNNKPISRLEECPKCWCSLPDPWLWKNIMEMIAYQKWKTYMFDFCMDNYEAILTKLWQRYKDREFIVRKILSPTDTK